MYTHLRACVGVPEQAARHTDNCFNVLFLDLLQLVFEVLFLGRFKNCFWALAWYFSRALAKSSQDAPKRPPGAPQEARRGPRCEDISGGDGLTTCAGHLAT